jgi:hypothetical protein
MRHMHNILKLCAPAVAAALLTACSKPEKTSTPPPEPPPTVSQPASPASPATPATAKPPVTAPVPRATPGKSSHPAEEAAALEREYVANPDFSARVETIYKLTDAGTPEAIASLGRLFQMEKDNDLKTEILDSLFDIDGQDNNKAALLGFAVSPSQPKEVRESAIDALEDIDAKYALPILQGLLADPDEEIRDAAKDAIEMLQTN